VRIKFRSLRGGLLTTAVSTAALLGTSIPPAHAAYVSVGRGEFGSATINASACKRYIPVYGGVWRVTYLAVRNDRYYEDVQLISRRSGAIIGTAYARTWWADIALGLDVNLSAPLGDTLDATVVTPFNPRDNPLRLTVGLSPSSLPPC
jgi:hypothetical protein